MNMPLQKAIIAIITASFIWAQLPQAALAGTDNITYNEPQVLTTLEESLNDHPNGKLVGSNKLLWAIVGTLVVGALAAALGGGGGGGGGGGKGSSSDPDKNDDDGSVSANW